MRIRAGRISSARVIIHRALFLHETTQGIDHYQSLQHLLSLSISGDVKFFKFQKEATAINRRFQDTRLDSLGGLVLPNLRTAFAVKYSIKVPSSIIPYWWFAPGMVLRSVKAVFEITFVAGNEDETLTYPEQCFLHPMALREKPLRTIEGPANHFERDFAQLMKTAADALQADFTPELFYERRST
jgi:hypothetical protein